MEYLTNLVYPTLQKQLELLNTVLIANDMVEFEDDDKEVNDLIGKDTFSFSRREGTIKSISGGDNMAYMEYSRSNVTSSGRIKEKRKLNT